MGLSAADTPAGRGACKNSVTHAVIRRRVNSSARLEIGECECV